MGVGEMQVSSSIIIIWQEWLSNETQSSQSKYLETIYYNLWAPTI